MDDKEQAAHDHAIERFVDVTLRNCLSLLYIIEADMKMADTEIPADDTAVYVTVASRVWLGYKLFAGYGATLVLNDHVRRVLMAPGRKEINETIDGKLNMVLSWVEERRKTNPDLDKIVRDMQKVSTFAQAFHLGQKEQS